MDEKKDTTWKKILNRAKIIWGDISHLLKENKKVALVVASFFVIVIVAVVISSMAGKHTATQEAAAVTEETAEEPTSTVEVPEEALEEDAHPAVNELVHTYYQALADGNVDTIRSIKNYSDDKEEIKIQKKSEFIENYPVIKVYTKQGPEEGSFVVYSYYEVKFLNYESTAPGLNTLYVCQDDTGKYYINDGKLSQNTIDYLKRISAQNDVIDLFNQVQVQYNEVKTEDVELSAFLDELPNLLTSSVGEALAQLEAENAKAEEPEEVTEEPEATIVVTKVKTTDVVNVRSSDSETADKLGKAQLGQVFDLVEAKVNGWSHIIYEGKDAYIKSDYLETAESTVVKADEQTETAEETTEETTAETKPYTTTKEGTKPKEETKPEVKEDTVTGTVTATDNVNVRASDSETGEKLGLCKKGTKLDLIEKQANGWTKVKYNGKVAYVKSDYVQ